ncbi:glycosyltransferase family 2 protein [Halosimplex marinum]|uniref:glycosyltransferase family 2 protein n=1 Tax=Halosimplex marinum TaxID=3396620 RepID=UPI003F55B8B8
MSSLRGVDAASAEVPDQADPAAEPESAAGRSVVAVVPAYNEAENIESVVRDAAEYVDKVVVVDDKSSDDTASVAEASDADVVSHPMNMGVGAAIHTGYQVAIREGFDLVVQIDADGQHDPSFIPEMLAKLDEDDADMVIGSRWLNSSYKEYSAVRRAGIRFFTLEANVLGGLSITDVTSGYRVYRVSMLEDLGRPENSHWALEQTLEAARKDYEITEVSVPMPTETEGSQFDVETFMKYPARMLLTTMKVLIFR